MNLESTDKEPKEAESITKYIEKEADLSPKIMKSARKGKKQGNGKLVYPIRILPKRAVKTVSK